MTALTEDQFTAALADLVADHEAATDALDDLAGPVIDECTRCGDRTEVERDEDDELVCRDCADPYDPSDEGDYLNDWWED